MLARTCARSRSVVNVSRAASISSAMFGLYTPMRSVRIVFLLSPCPLVAHTSGPLQLIVARIRGATRSSAGTIISVNTCVCIAIFRRPKTAHLGRFDWIDRISSSPPTIHSLVYSLHAHSRTHFHTPQHVHSCIAQLSSLCTSYHVSRPRRLSVSCFPARLAMPDLDLSLLPTLSRFVCARWPHPSVAPRARVFTWKPGGFGPAPPGTPPPAHTSYDHYCTFLSLFQDN
jgi:hypothetical protein